MCTYNLKQWNSANCEVEYFWWVSAKFSSYMTSCTEFEYTFKMYSFEVANCLKTREQIRKDSHGTTFGVQRGGMMKTTGGEHPVWRCGAIPRPLPPPLPLRRGSCPPGCWPSPVPLHWAGWHRLTEYQKRAMHTSRLKQLVQTPSLLSVSGKGLSPLAEA